MATNKKTIELDIDAKINAAKAEDDLRKLTRLLKDLNSELSSIDETSADWNRLKDAISEVEGKIGDANDRMKTITGEPLERVNNGLSLVSEGLMNLDFGKATIGLKGMRDGVDKLNFGNVSKGVKEVGTEFLNLGKSLLGNPLFKIGATIAVIVMNFEKLTKVGGLVGDIFKGIEDAIKAVTDGIVAFSDALGITATKAEELEKYNKDLKNSLSSFYDVVADGEIAIKQALNQSTLALELEKQTRAREKAIDALFEVYKKEIKTEQDRKDARAYIYKIGLENMQSVFKEQYGIVEGGVEALEKVYEEWEKLEQTHVKRQVENFKEVVGIIKENEKNRISLIQNGLTKELELIKLNTALTDEERKTQKKRLLDDIEEQNRISNLGTIKRGEDAKLFTQKRIEEETKLDNLLMLHKKYLGQKSYDFLAKKEMEQNIAMTKRRIQTYIDGEKVMYDLQGIALKNYLGQKAEIEKTFAEQEKNQKAKDEKDKQQLLLQERIKANENQQEAARQQFEKEKVNTDLSFQDNLNLEADYYYKVLDLQEKNYKLQLQKDGLTEQDRVKLKLDYNKKTEDAKKVHNDNLDKLFDEQDKRVNESADNLKKMAESLKDSGITQTYEESIDVLVKNKENRMQSIMGELDNLNRSSIVSEFLVGKKLNLIKEAADTERDILFNKYRLEIAAAEKAGLDITEIEKKYAKEKEKITLNERDSKIKTIQDVAKKGVELAQYGMDVANELGALANAKDEALRDEQGRLDLAVQERIFNRNKNFQYANAVMNTAAAVTGALAASGGINWPAAIAAGAAGLVQILKIKATQFKPEGGSGGGDTIDIKAPEMAERPKNPFFSQGYMAGISPNGEFGFRPGNNQMLRVGVYENDIRTTMNKVNVLETRSTLSGAGY